MFVYDVSNDIRFDTVSSFEFFFSGSAPASRLQALQGQLDPMLLAQSAVLSQLYLDRRGVKFTAQ